MSPKRKKTTKVMKETPPAGRLAESGQLEITPEKKPCGRQEAPPKDRRASNGS